MELNTETQIEGIRELIPLNRKVIMVLASGLIAKELHAGQKDKGGNDYFESHLLTVANHGHDWKEKVVGFLHDASEDTPHTVDEVITKLLAKTDELIATPIEKWWQPWMENSIQHDDRLSPSFTPDGIADIKSALELLNHNTAPTREEYISRMSNNPLAIKVKLNDLENNMDISRIPEPSQKDFNRLTRYQKEHRQLLETLQKKISPS